MNEPVISFEKYEILKIDYSKINELEEGEIKTKVSIGISERLDAAKVEIKVKVSDPTNYRVIKVKVRGYFLINDNKDQESIEQFLSQNGTAILYPYVRSIISMISSLDSEEAILLPTINTLANKKD